MTRIFRPAYVIEELGELGLLPDGAITNIGGTDNPYFTVGGRALMFADGTATAPTPGSGVVLQGVYDNSLTGNINLGVGKSFILTSTSGRRLVFDASTGAVTIDGDLSVLGSSTVIEGTVQNTDALHLISPTATNVVFTLTPAIGVTPAVDLVQVRNTFNGSPVFSITAGGITKVATLIVDSTINGINLTSLNADVQYHLDGALDPAKHTAAQISIDATRLVNVTGANVQEVIEAIDAKLTSVSTTGVQGFEFVQVNAALIWTINHGAGSRRVQITVWDTTDQVMLPDTIAVQDGNTVRIVFNTPATGRAILMIF